MTHRILAKRARFVVLSAILLLQWPGDGSAQRRGLEGPPLLRIGAVDEPEVEVFGSIRAVRAGPGRSVLVLDAMSGEIRWFRSDGRFLARAGRKGAGPGEFRAPVELIVGADNVVYVLDPPNLKVSKFRPGPAGLEHIEDRRTPPAYDFCLLDDRTFILFPTPNGFVHEIDTAGEVKRTFGATQQVRGRGELPNDLQLDLLNRGHLLCDPQSEAIIFLSERLPLVLAYTPDGRALWSTELREYRTVVWESSDGRIRMAADPATGTAHTGKAIVGAAEEILIVLHEGSLANPEGSLELRILDGKSGREIRRQIVPFVITDARADYLYGYSSVPYPHVAVY